jgi:hypothetical protein
MARRHPDIPPLFPHDRRRTPSAPKDPELGKALQDLMFRVYVPIYQQRCGERPHIGGMEWGILKTLLSANGPMPDLTMEQRKQTVDRRLRIYLNWTDPWIRSKGYTLSLFRSRWNELRAMDEAQNGRRSHGRLPECRHQPPCRDEAEHTSRSVTDWRGDLNSSPF